jgi:hypothetical protein
MMRLMEIRRLMEIEIFIESFLCQLRKMMLQFLGHIDEIDGFLVVFEKFVIHMVGFRMINLMISEDEKTLLIGMEE